MTSDDFNDAGYHVNDQQLLPYNHDLQYRYVLITLLTDYCDIGGVVVTCGTITTQMRIFGM